jgi:NAD(P)-dependent dehydrogenase (short-subunit alcohol dehydrogenase family)
MGDLTGKTALVTGASRGIGRAIAERLARDGALVAVHYGSNEDAARAVTASIEQSGGRALPIRAQFGLDGLQPGLDTLFAGLEEGLDGQGLDILVNNAGILEASPIDQVTTEEFDRTFAINLRTPFFILQRALRLLRDGGRIINISSATTRIASPFVHYAMSKGAIEVLGRTLAQQLGPRQITVNNVSPGVVETDQAGWLDSGPDVRAAVTSTVALGRIGEPEDVAEVVAFLASEEGRWITGQTLEASGGQWLGPGG